LGTLRLRGMVLTLTEANLVVYYANDFQSWKQGSNRKTGPTVLGSATRSPTLILSPRDSIDEKIVKSLRDKIDIGAKVLGEQAREWLTLTPNKG
jgi:hypothetical protein